MKKQHIIEFGTHDFTSKNVKPKKYPVIEFEKNFNGKLFCDIFTTIVPSKTTYEIRKRFEIRLDNKHFCYAEICDIRIRKIDEIIMSGIAILDSSLLDSNDFLDMMEDKYDKKPWWLSLETKMTVLFLKKVTQLDIFEDEK
jgi:hypothetical protein